MENSNCISIEKISIHYSVPVSFFTELEEMKLIEIVILDEAKHIEVQHIKAVEKLIRLHFELNINMEGLDVVNNLLDEVIRLKDENLYLKNRLKRFE